MTRIELLWQLKIMTEPIKYNPIERRSLFSVVFALRPHVALIGCGPLFLGGSFFSLLVSTHWLHSVYCNREHCDVLRYDGAVYVLGGFSRGGDPRALLTKTALLLVTHVRY